jgi:hypothetical protein
MGSTKALHLKITSETKMRIRGVHYKPYFFTLVAQQVSRRSSGKFSTRNHPMDLRR